MSELELRSNPYAQWVLSRLNARLGASPSKDSLSLKIVQNPLIYLAVLGVKRCGREMSTATRHREVANSYKNFVLEHAVEWLAEEGGITKRPAWLTRDMLGKTTLSDANNGYLTNGSKLCARYDEAGRTCRRDMAAFLDRNAPEQKLKSGTQATDFMNNLNNHMWSLSSEGKRRAAEAAASSGEIDPTADPVSSGESSPGDEGEAPEHWIHVNLLTFALFGPFSYQNDSDLALSSSDGPSRKTPPAAGSPESEELSGGSASPEIGIESSNCIKLLAASDGKTSRRGIKKAMEANQVAVNIEAESGTKRKVVDILERQQHQSGDMALATREWRESLKKKELANQDKARRKKHADHVRSIRHANRQKVKMHDREIKHLERRLALARDNGDDEERRLVYNELKEALKTKVQLQEVPGPLAEGWETALSAEAAATTEATPGPTPMTGTPPSMRLGRATPSDVGNVRRTHGTRESHIRVLPHDPFKIISRRRLDPLVVHVDCKLCAEFVEDVADRLLADERKLTDRVEAGSPPEDVE